MASGRGDAKILRKNQEWPKKVVFSRACRTHTLALSMIRAHTWLSVACLDCLQAPGEIAAGISLLPPWLLPSLLPSLLPLLPFSLPPPPSPHLRPHPRRPNPRGRPSSLWLASGYHQGAGLRMREHCARAARQRTEQSAAASSNTEKAKWPLDAFVVCVHEVCCRMIKICMSVRFICL